MVAVASHLPAIALAAILGTVVMSTMTPRPDDPRADPIFRKWPLSGAAKLASGEVKTPFHGYDMTAYIVTGHVDYDTASAVLKDTKSTKVPARTSDGRALASIWVMKYRDTAIGPYDEVVVSFLSSTRSEPLELSCRSTDTFCNAHNLMNNPDTQTLVYKLWLTEQVPVDYGRDILGANKYLVRHDNRANDPSQVKKMSVEHGASSVKLVIPGVLELEAPHPTVGTTLAAFPSLIRTAGVVDTIRMLLNKVVAVNIAFSVDVAPRFKSTHPECVSWMHAGPDAAFGEWSPDAKLKMMAPDLQSLGFTPVVAQIDPQLRFALSDPLNGGV